MYSNGQGVPQDDKIAVKWYKLAAEQRNADTDINNVAEFNLAMMYAMGEGVPRDYRTAAQWVKSAAKKENASTLPFLPKIKKLIEELN